MLDKQIGHEHGVALHVRAAKVKRPSHIVERANQSSVGMFAAQRLPYAVYLMVCFFASQFQGLQFNAVGGYLWAVGPYRFQRVEVGPQRQPAKFSQLCF